MLVSLGAALRPLAVALVLTVGVFWPSAPPAQAQSQAQSLAPVEDPTPDPVQSGLALTLQEVITMPRSEPVPAPTDPRLIRSARINYLGQVPDRSGRMFVPDLNGKLHFVHNGTSVEYLDAGAQAGPDFWSHRGLGSGLGFVAFHPQFASNGLFYSIHTEARDALLTKTPDLPAQANAVVHGVLVEWKADDPSANSFTGTRREILRLGFGSYIHGYQEIGFNPTAHPWSADYGLLYVAVGDGGRGRTTTDPQNVALPHGKILRIDPSGTNGVNGKYGIPASNPFVGKPGALGEVYAYGLRNPHRFSWDRFWPHRMFVGNIGEHVIESVYEVRAGDNFGWSEREGSFLHNRDDRCNVYPLPADDAQFGYTYPVVAYDHEPPAGWPCGQDTGDAVIGGFVYRGLRVPALWGKYVFGDDVDGRLFYSNSWEMRRGSGQLAPIYQFLLLDPAGRRISMKDLAGDARVDLRFGTDAHGEIYLLSKANGKIWKITGARHFAGCDVGDTTVSNVMAKRNWAPVTPAKWRFPGKEVILAEPGVARPGPRRPFEYAVLTAGPTFGSTQIDAEVRLDTPVEVSNRDVILVFGYRSDTQFYYVHLSSDNTIYPHNGIFVVNNADRLRLDHQWNGSTGAPPAIRDALWHKVRVVHCAGTGEIAVYVDGSNVPLMTAVDTTFGTGRVGFGSFDNIGRLRNLRVTGDRQ
ncbi:MAG TPA: hypothetical protein DGG94_10415 [Micromonosporaceae bacterium]|nr:hypothetical protein [Micromonosporaceae bacterium]HCU50196.1 hypothetical protein [Micromonosporaceae bacterium]